MTHQGQSKLFSKLPPPKNSSHEPLAAVVKTDKPQFLKKSVPLIPQSVTRKQVASKDSDDEDVSDSFFTINEPALKPLTEPLNIGLEINPSRSTSYEQDMVYTAMPTNQQYNMAGLSEAEVNQHSEHSGLELDDIAVSKRSSVPIVILSFDF